MVGSTHHPSGSSPFVKPRLIYVVSESPDRTVGVTARSTLRIYLDVGRNDPLASSVASFAAAAQARGLPTVFHRYDGGHNRDYWRAHTAEYLVFYTAAWRR